MPSRIRATNRPRSAPTLGAMATGNEVLMQYEPTAAEIAWAAGLFEGEGTWGYQPNNVRAALAMSDHDVVRRFHEVVGVGYCALKKKYADHHKQQLYWQVSHRAGVAHVLGLFAPWLGPRRLERWSGDSSHSGRGDSRE